MSEVDGVRHMPQERVELLEQRFAEDIGDPRFIPYIQLHEYEAYLFADPTWFEYFYDHHKNLMFDSFFAAYFQQLTGATLAISDELEQTAVENKELICLAGKRVEH